MNNESLIIEHLSLAEKLAYKKKKVLPSFVNVEELKSAAYLGLVEAASRFDSEYGVAFSTFAYPRIFGAIHDYLREIGWHKSGTKMVSLDASDDDDCCLADTLTAREDKSSPDDFFEIIARDLDVQGKQILRQYYIEDRSMKEIGDSLNVSESRISQKISSYKEAIGNNWSKSELSELAA